MKKSLLFILSLFFSTFSYGQGETYTDPYQLIEVVAGQTFERVKREAELIESEPQYAEEIVVEELLPYVDYKYAAYKVIGPGLKKTTKEQRIAFVDAFKQHLINTYSTVLFKYNSQQLKLPAAKDTANKKIVSIPVRFVEAGKPDINVNFKLRKNKKTGHWKVFDVVAEGISLLATKQSELRGLIKKQGIDEVTELLVKKNQVAEGA